VARRPLRAALAAATLLVIGLAIVLGGVYREMYHDRELQEQQKAADDAKRAVAEAQKSLENLKQIIAITMSGDLHTPVGLERLEKNLQQHADVLEENGSDPDKAMVLASAFTKLALLWRDQNDVEHALHALGKAEELARLAADHTEYEPQMN